MYSAIKNNVVPLILFSVVIFGFGLAVGCTVVNNIQSYKIEQELIELDAVVHSNVEIESPSVMFIVDDYIMFKLLYGELGPSVYRVVNTFYLFSDDYQIGYKFRLYPMDALTGVIGLGE